MHRWLAQDAGTRDKFRKTGTAPAVQPQDTDTSKTKRSIWNARGRLIYYLAPVVLLIAVVIYCFQRPHIPHIESILNVYPTAAVASDSAICSEIGRVILEEKNGTAADAAIASLFCMGVVNFHSMGIGGGHVASIYDRESNQVYVLNAREKCPSQALQELNLNNSRSPNSGPLSIAVPGELKGYWAIHQRFGQLPWSELIQPSIDLCEQGFNFTLALARARNTVIKTKRMTDDVRHRFVNEETLGYYRVDEIYKCPENFTRTLRILAQEGAESFYDGTIAKLVVQDIEDKGGVISEEDLRNYTVQWQTPMSITLRDGLRVFTPPSPSVGPLLTLLLNILDGLDYKNFSSTDGKSQVQLLHRMVEAMKLVMPFRTELADPSFLNVTEIEQKLASKEFADLLREKIADDHTFGTNYYGSTPYDQLKPGTAHLSVVDKRGSAVAITATINQYMGSTVVGSRTAIVFNNVMDDFGFPNRTNHFNLEPAEANYAFPGKRPLSFMCPVVILKKDNSIKMVTGAAGGSKIPNVLAQVIMRVLRLGQNLTEATDAPRLHHQLIPEELFAEVREQQAILDGLKAKGHIIKRLPIRSSVVQSIVKEDDGLLHALSDDRKGGVSSGY